MKGLSVPILTTVKPSYKRLYKEVQEEWEERKRRSQVVPARGRV